MEEPGSRVQGRPGLAHLGREVIHFSHTWAISLLRLHFTYIHEHRFEGWESSRN